MQFKSVLKNTRQQSYRLLILQTMAVLVVMGAWAWEGGAAMVSVLLGGLVWLLPSAGFAWLMFRKITASAALQIVRSFYLGEFLKLMVCGVLSVIVMTRLPVQLLPFVSGLFAAQLGIWLAPWSSTWNPWRPGDAAPVREA